MRPERLEEAERLIREHPAAREHAEVTAIARTIDAVFVPNGSALLSLLQKAASDPELAIELVQNVRETNARVDFEHSLTRALHNYLAGATTLVDHTRRLMRNRTGTTADEFERRKDSLLQEPEIAFMRDLRNFTLHRTLPLLGHRVTFTAVNTQQQEMDSEVELSTAALLEWKGWSPTTRRFLTDRGDSLALRPVVEQHLRLLTELNIWLCDTLMHSIDLTEVNELVVRRNAILAGVDIDTARRLTDDWSEGYFSFPGSKTGQEPNA